MNHEGDLTPATAPDTGPGGEGASPGTSGNAAGPARSDHQGRGISRVGQGGGISQLLGHRRFLIPAAGVAVIAVAAAAALMLRPTPSVEKMVPGSVDLYAVANLDPSMSQKLDLLRAVHRFPDTSTDQKIAQKLDQALKASGISYSQDVQPWLGAEIGFAVKVPSGNADAPAALFAVSRDDKKAQAALAKLRAGGLRLSSGQKAVFRPANQAVKSPQNYTWQDTSYDGVTIAVGTPTATASQPAAYAIVDHVVVLANSEALIREIIDTDRGRAARLVDAAGYKATLSQLPSDHLALGYVDGKSAISHLKDQLRTPLAAGLTNLKGLGDAEAFQGGAVVISARQDGVVADIRVRLDPSKLSASTREALTHAGRPDSVIGWIPGSTDGFFAFANLNQATRSLLDQAGSDPSIRQATDEIGLTGPHGVLSHLTGDFAVEADINSGFVPGGAVLLGTKNAASMSRFLGGILALATQGQAVQAPPTVSSYRGVTITSMTMPEFSLSGFFVPSYGVMDGMGIMASSPDELKAIVDAHKDHAAIDKDATYAAASRASLPHPSAVFFIDLARLMESIQSAPAGSSPFGGFDGANLTPLKAFILTSASSQYGILERLVVFIQ